MKIATALAVAALAMLSASCEPPAAAPSAPASQARVFVAGDSLTTEARSSGEPARLGQYRVDWSGALFGGAPCNGVATAQGLRYRPDVVAIAYSGNGNGIIDNCMSGETGRSLTDRYVADVGTLIDLFDNGHTRVVIVGAPMRMDKRSEADAVFDALRRLAESRGVAFVDGGTQITPGRSFRSDAPCLPSEKSCGSASKGRNVVRSADRIHFCPTGPDLYGRCSVYSSGSVRYTLALQRGIVVSRPAT